MSDDQAPRASAGSIAKDDVFRTSTIDILRRKGKHGLSGMLDAIRADLIRALEKGAPLDTGVRATIPAHRIGEPAVVLAIELQPTAARQDASGEAAPPSLDALMAKIQDRPGWSIYAACNMVHGVPFYLAIMQDDGTSSYRFSGSGDDFAGAWAELDARMKGESWPPIQDGR